MFYEFLAGTGLLFWPMVGFGIFLVTFVGVLIHTVFGWGDGRSERMASLPLGSDEEGVPQ